MGAQCQDPSRPNYDPEAQLDESAQFEDRRIAFPGKLAAYFLSKYEVSRAQWRRLAGHDASASTSDAYPGGTHSSLQPAERIDWSEAQEVLLETGLRLPSEARWEYAARAGTTTPWWTGVERESLRGAANLADVRSTGWGDVVPSERSDWPELDDGFAGTAPIGSLRPNAFGLHDVCGNVSEWCSDTGFVTYDLWANFHFGDLERRIIPGGMRIRRGGSCASRAASCRSAARTYGSPKDVRSDTGVRPARDLDE
jgi:formylglycine-generating enzyme required for sulfatase activity